jgi:nitrous oxide reductase accessory protein NosL
MRKMLALAVIVVFAAGAAYAGPKNKTQKPAKLTEVVVCPITGNKVEGKGGGTTVYKNYRVHFCCDDCKPAFNTLTDAEKERKIKIALKKQNKKS